MKEPFLQAIPILKRIEKYGFEAYFVGGSIRDLLLKRTISDVDIATSATPEEIKNIFNRTVDIGIEHGTVLVLYQDKKYEVTTFRSESQYKDHRHPDKVSFIRSLKMDLERRDFTMNAIAMDQFGNLKDPFDGKQDIEKKIIRTVGAAESRFREDALRMMRAVRFVSQLEFSIDQNTRNALTQHAHLLNFIAVERITNEFVKLLSGTAKTSAISILLDTNLVEFMPNPIDTKISLTKCSDFQIDILTENQMWLIILYFQSGEPVDYLKKWRLPNHKIKYLTTCLRFLKGRELKEWSELTLYPLNLEMAIDIETVYRTLQKQSITKVYDDITNKYNSLVIKSREELQVTGKDLIYWLNRPAGPWIKNALKDIEEAVLLKKIENSKDAIKGWILNQCNHRQERN
ncbi:CCA tRNA nucleotidyltransferase [Heyndrickxia camelliae]|uniref:CCA-adding enzyme n=1 Tax=Heyndrickxia camelliae TaxID=1707093 RepID=A0A2N3LMT4_9BACI|nr:CCA tRNA nucleotidyltransferase [Heyndrickxia camelliae]PKR85885.1 CCA tRNA nucleotidyltransferase [Heyndrickxia camelliae]